MGQDEEEVEGQVSAHQIHTTNFAMLHKLKQGSKTVEEYAREFEHLIMKCALEEDDEQTYVRFLGG